MDGWRQRVYQAGLAQRATYPPSMASHAVAYSACPGLLWGEGSQARRGSRVLQCAHIKAPSPACPGSLCISRGHHRLRHLAEIIVVFPNLNFPLPLLSGPVLSCPVPSPPPLPGAPARQPPTRAFARLFPLRCVNGFATSPTLLPHSALVAHPLPARLQFARGLLLSLPQSPPASLTTTTRPCSPPPFPLSCTHSRPLARQSDLHKPSLPTRHARARRTAAPSIHFF